MVSFWDAIDALREGRLVHILPDWYQPADIWAVSIARLGSSAKVRLCVDTLKQQFTRGPLALPLQTGLLSKRGRR